MRGGFAFSIGVHALILFLIIVGLPFLRIKPPADEPMVSVELVEIAKQTTTNKVSPANRVEKQPQPDQPPPPPQPPQSAPEPTTQPQPPAPPQPTPREAMDAPAPSLEKVDDTVQPLETPELTIKEPPKPAPKLAEIDDTAPKLVVPPASVKPHFAPTPSLAPVDEKLAALVPPAKEVLKRPEPKPPARSFDSVLKNLTKTEPQESTPDAPPQPVRAPTHRASGAQAPLSQQLTATEMDALKQQLARCWNLPASAKDAQDLVVDIDVTVNPDRTVATSQIVDQGRMSDPTYAAAARAAQRAVRAPGCTPLDLPPEKYAEWQSISIRFDPKEMLGQ